MTNRELVAKIIECLEVKTDCVAITNEERYIDLLTDSRNHIIFEFDKNGDITKIN